MRFLVALYLTVLSFAASAESCVTQDFGVDNAWARLAPPSAPVMAGFVSITNSSAASQSIISAKSADFDRVEMHSMSMDGGMMRMRKLNQLDVAAGETLQLKPGGLHLMLIGPKREFAAGDKILIEFSSCEDAPSQSVIFEVREGKGA